MLTFDIMVGITVLFTSTCMCWKIEKITYYRQKQKLPSRFWTQCSDEYETAESTLTAKFFQAREPDSVFQSEGPEDLSNCPHIVLQ